MNVLQTAIILFIDEKQKVDGETIKKQYENLDNILNSSSKLFCLKFFIFFLVNGMESTNSKMLENSVLLNSSQKNNENLFNEYKENNAEGYVVDLQNKDPLLKIQELIKWQQQVSFFLIYVKNGTF